jgi:hypothetical protein
MVGGKAVEFISASSVQDTNVRLEQYRDFLFAKVCWWNKLIAKLRMPGAMPKK